MLQLLKRYREFALGAAALAVPLIVYFAHARHPGERNAFDRAVVKVARPLELLLGATITGAGDAWRGYLALRGAHQRAFELQDRVNRLEVEGMEVARLRSENQRLRQLLAFAPAAGDRPLVGARVVGARLDPKGMQLITIDRGADAGLVRMMPVVAAQGVVGRVHAVQGGSAEVLLLTDRNSAIAVRVERSRARANVRGTGDPSRCRLDYALRADDLEDGDLLVTSGTDGVFPRGLPVGKVEGVKKGGQGLYQRAEVAPAVEVTQVEEVLVLGIFPAEAAAQVAP